MLNRAHPCQAASGGTDPSNGGDREGGTLHSPWQSQPQDTGGPLEDSPGSCLDYVTVPTTAVHAWFRVHCCHTSTISRVWINFLLCCCFLLEWSTLVGVLVASLHFCLSAACSIKWSTWCVSGGRESYTGEPIIAVIKINLHSFTVYNLLI